MHARAWRLVIIIRVRAFSCNKSEAISKSYIIMCVSTVDSKADREEDAR